MLGFLCCHEPWEHAFQSLAKGTFSPIHAHGSVKENRGKVYQRMYQAAAEKWVKKGIAYHSIALYAHEETALSAFFDYGFGRRCADAIRMMEPLGNYTPPVGITFKEEDGKEKEQVNRLHRMLKEHMGKSPCFILSGKRRRIRSSFRKKKAVPGFLQPWMVKRWQPMWR